jgi:hypothetical protein
VLVHLSAAPSTATRTPPTPLPRTPSVLAFGLATDHKMIVTVVSGDPVDYIDGVPGPFLDEPDGTIAIGESHTFTRGTMLRATGEVDVEIEHWSPAQEGTEEPEGPDENGAE